MARSPGAQLLSCRDTERKTVLAELWLDAPTHTHPHTHLASAAEAGHSVSLAHVVEAGLGQLGRRDDGERPGVEGVQTLLLPPHVGVITRWPLVRHVLHATGAQGAGGRRRREAHVQITHWFFTLTGCGVGGGAREGRSCSVGELDDRKAKGSKLLMSDFFPPDIFTTVDK